jgi:hypothetical protein
MKVCITQVGGEIMKIETIHESLVNGQRRQMVEQIKEYGLYDFFSDYRDYLKDLYFDSLLTVDSVTL